MQKETVKCLQDIKNVFHFSTVSPDGSVYPLCPIPGRPGSKSKFHHSFDCFSLSNQKHFYFYFLIPIEGLMYNIEQRSGVENALFLTDSNITFWQRRGTDELKIFYLPLPKLPGRIVNLLDIQYFDQKREYFTLWKLETVEGSPHYQLRNFSTAHQHMNIVLEITEFEVDDFAIDFETRTIVFVQSKTGEGSSFIHTYNLDNGRTIHSSLKIKV